MKKIFKAIFVFFLFISLSFLATYQFFPGVLDSFSSWKAFSDAGMEVKKLNVDGDIFEYAEGKGEEYVVFVHGFHSDKKSFLGYTKGLAEKFKPVLIDLSGHGGSSRHKGQHYDMISLSRDLAKFIETKKISSCHLVGSSMGGGVVFHYYLEHPEKVKSLVLLNPLGVEPPKKSDFQLALDKGKNYLLPDDMKDFEEFEKIVVGRPLKINAHFKKYALQKIIATKDFYSEAFKELVSTRPLDKKHYAVHIPMLLLGGVKDRVLDFSSYELFKAKIPTARFIKIEDGSHVFVGDAFYKAREEIHHFLKKVAKID